MAGIFVVAVHLNVVHAIKFTILRFLRSSFASFENTLYFLKIVKITKRKKHSFLHFLLDISKFNSKYLNINSRLLVYSSCSDTIIYIYTFDYYFQARIRIVITHVWPLNSHASRSLQSFFSPILARGRSKLLQHKNTQPRMCANQYQLREKLSPIRVN